MKTYLPSTSLIFTERGAYISPTVTASGYRYAAHTNLAWSFRFRTFDRSSVSGTEN